MALRVLGYPEDDADYQRGLKSLDALLSSRGGEDLCQPCHSPIWDSALSLSALLEAGLAPDHPATEAAIDWLDRQEVRVRGDWGDRAPGLEPGGWAFQFENALYPDVDDTPMVLMALLRAGALEQPRYREVIARAVRWVIGMQSADGGWGAFDIDNNALYLNDIPFADHGALLDPSTADLTGRCLELLSLLGFGRDFPPVARALEFLRREQETSGAWFGRWGVNYIYGTWSVLMGLRQAGEDPGSPWIRRAVDWLNGCQNPDGGWGETCYSYDDPSSGRSGAEHGLPDRLGTPRPDGGRGGGKPGGAAGHKLPADLSERAGGMERDAVHRHRFPPRLLPALSWIRAVLSPLGAGRLPAAAQRRPHVRR